MSQKFKPGDTVIRVDYDNGTKAKIGQQAVVLSVDSHGWPRVQYIYDRLLKEERWCPIYTALVKAAAVSIEDAKKTLEEAGYRVTPPPSKAELRAFLEEVLGYYTEAGPLTNNEVVLRSKLLELIDKAQF